MNLCDNCTKHFATCKSKVRFGNGKGNDNVIECDIHSELKIHQTYKRYTYEWKDNQRKAKGTFDCVFVRLKNGRVDFYYISDTDNINTGQISLYLFLKEIV